MVQEGRGHAAIDVWAIGEAALWSVSLVCGAGGDRAPSRSGLLHAGGRLPPARASGIDNLQRAESGATPPPEAAASRIVRRQRNGTPSARLARPKQAGKLAVRNAALRTYVEERLAWRRCGSERGSCSRPGRVLEKPSARTSEGPAMGKTPGARSRSPVACRWTSRTTRPCASAMKPSIKRCSFKVEARCAAN